MNFKNKISEIDIDKIVEEEEPDETMLEEDQ